MSNSQFITHEILLLSQVQAHKCFDFTVGAELFYITKNNRLRLDEFCAVVDAPNKEELKHQKIPKYKVLMHPCAASYVDQVWEYTDLVIIVSNLSR